MGWGVNGRAKEKFKKRREEDKKKHKEMSKRLAEGKDYFEYFNKGGKMNTEKK